MERQYKTFSKRFYCAFALAVLFGLVVAPSAVHGQDSSTTVAERIEKVRDGAAVLAEPQAAVEQTGVEVESVEEQPLPPNELLPLGAGESALFGGAAEASDTSSLGDGWLLSTLAALGVVLAIVFGLRWVLKRGGVVSTATPQGGVVEVLSRTTVAPRSHVVLMRVGTRVLVVSDSPNGMRTLASVHEAEEVAELLGAIDSAKPTSMSQSFGSVMKKLSGQWSAEDELADAPESVATEPETAVAAASGALSRVRGRLAALTDTGGRP